MSCDRMELLLQAYLDNELTVLTRQTVEKHLAHCPKCNEDLHDLKLADSALADWLKSKVDVHPSQDFATSVLIKRRQIPMPAPTQHAIVQGTQRMESWAQYRKGWRLSTRGRKVFRNAFWVAALAAAASALIVFFPMLREKNGSGRHDYALNWQYKPSTSPMRPHPDGRTPKSPTPSRSVLAHIANAASACAISNISSLCQASAARLYAREAIRYRELITLEQLATLHGLPAPVDEKKMIMEAMIRDAGPDLPFLAAAPYRHVVLASLLRHGLQPSALFNMAYADDEDAMMNMDEIQRLEMQGRYQEALRKCRDALSAPGGEASMEIRFQEAVMLMKLGSLEQAVARFQNVVAGSHGPLMELGMRLKRECTNMLQERMKPLPVAGDDAQPQQDYALALAYIARGQYGHAQARLLHVLTKGQAPADQNVRQLSLLRLALLFKLTGDMQHALEAAGSLARTSRDLEAVGRSLEGNIYYRLGQYPASRGAYLASVRLLHAPADRQWKSMMLLSAALVEYHHLQDLDNALLHLGEVSRYSSGKLTHVAGLLMSRWEKADR